MYTSLSPSNYAACVVGAGGKTVIATRERIERRHYIVLPDKAQADIARLSAEKRRTAPRFSVRFGRVSLRDSGDDAPVVFHRPGYIAVLVRCAECSEVKDRTVAPQRGMAFPDRWLYRESSDPTAVVYAIAAAISPEVVQES